MYEICLGDFPEGGLKFLASYPLLAPQARVLVRGEVVCCFSAEVLRRGPDFEQCLGNELCLTFPLRIQRSIFHDLSVASTCSHSVDALPRVSIHWSGQRTSRGAFKWSSLKGAFLVFFVSYFSFASVPLDYLCLAAAFGFSRS